MALALKDQLDSKLITDLSREISKRTKQFDRKTFESICRKPLWDGLELKQRIHAVSNGFQICIDGSYEYKTTLLCEIASSYSGLQGMVFPTFVELYGTEHLDLSLKVLKYVTTFSTSEFGIRPFILQDPDKVMRVMKDWTQDDNEHVRRLASEGCRPRLPWASVLLPFIKDPSPVLEILEALKNDQSRYVQKSVANNLNDISKEHPEKLKNLIRQWGFKNKNTRWILKHGARTLLKEGDIETMRLFGYDAPNSIQVTDLKLEKEFIQKGDIFNFYFNCNYLGQDLFNYRIEYIVQYPRSNGNMYHKVFFLKESVFKRPTSITLKGKLDFEEKSTRKIYPGQHQLDIKVNGLIIKSTTIDVYTNN